MLECVCRRAGVSCSKSFVGFPCPVVPRSTHPSICKCIRVECVGFKGALSERVVSWGSNDMRKQLVLRMLKILSEGFNVFAVYLPWVGELVCLFENNAVRVCSINICGLEFEDFTKSFYEVLLV